MRNSRGLARGTGSVAAAVVTALLVWGAAPSASARGDSESRAAAESLVNRYIAALQDGDTDTLLALLGDPLLARQSRMLGNPAYGGFLRDRYRGAVVHITGSQSRGASTIVDVDIRLADGSVVLTRLLVGPGPGDPNLRIRDELDER